ncbi:MAG: dTDP-glucose 4,6-dehydratase [Bacteroidetes bacterium]|nr:dTDP-glucose 4,6-dehydratase [Rhodothermia bacterium]MCX7907232.1 dTDP-glucose 4,6-dehydratase [Bacteroidota bacterium]MDW8286106.1 dTDP-glucose 4,6-dehydratase [Bacteroidota bacterium]
MRRILVTGGAGFIGSNLLLELVPRYPDYLFVNLDKLTYAGNLENLRPIESAPNYVFVRGDVADAELIDRLFRDFGLTGVIHLAAESHVDRSILEPDAFLHTNVLGTLTLLKVAQRHWEGRSENEVRFYHISTDEVYGSLGPTGYFTEESPYRPTSPYAASKAASDHLVRAWHHTYGLPVVISNCSNNFGPYQFPEKLIPLMIRNLIQLEPLPIYGSGENVRDWIYVRDHVAAIELIYHAGRVGQTYNVGARNEWRNRDLVELLCDLLDAELGRPPGMGRSLIRFVPDRPGHDRRYAIDPSKLERELGWRPRYAFAEALRETIRWYLANQDWLERVTSGAYREYYARQYAQRIAEGRAYGA